MDSQKPSGHLIAAAVLQQKTSQPDKPRVRARVRGLVQGVGFRPHVYKLALRCQLTGWVCNDGEGVLLEVEGARMCEFLHLLISEKPTLSRIDNVETETIPSPEKPETEFLIVESQQSAITTSIVPDAATCDACLAESLDTTDKRYHYAFLNCTHCGPRYTITRELPYDRKQTSMAKFPMCPNCEREYKDPLDRRFHAQPTACPACGPHLSTSINSIVENLKKGEIVAIKGLGGFHLACDATNEKAVAALRERKNREAKPFAIMVANLVTAEQLVDICPAGSKLLQGVVRPIVVFPQKDAPNIALAPSVAPGMNSLGVMLPYTPLQHLIFHEAAGRPSHNMYASAAQSFVLVMTSANPGGEPLVIENTEAASRLGGIADSIVTHNRDIIIRVDDSVTRVVNGAPYFIRRARGYVPESIKLPYAVPCTLAFGADLKNTICITRGNEAFVSQHIGDIDNAKTVEFLHETVQHLLSILAVKPERIACDLHPDFHTSRLAASWNLPTIRVQHHHAHAASVAVEHGITTPVLGVALDGFGLGTDGTLWGGELLHVKGAQFERLGHFRPLAEPGGDKAAREPWRMAAAALHDMGRGHEIAARFSKIPLASALANMLDAGINSPKTSSCGRLFDAACGLAGVKDVALYEGEAPMLFESLVRATRPIHELWSISPTLELDWRPLLAHIAEESTPQSAAEIFHGTLVGGLTEWVLKGAERSQAQTVVLCGGCFLNHILVSELSKSLEARGLRVLVPRVLPPNDGGISLGQAWIAALTSH